MSATRLAEINTHLPTLAFSPHPCPSPLRRSLFVGTSSGERGPSHGTPSEARICAVPRLGMTNYASVSLCTIVVIVSRLPAPSAARARNDDERHSGFVDHLVQRR